MFHEFKKTIKITKVPIVLYINYNTHMSTMLLNQL